MREMRDDLQGKACSDWPEDCVTLELLVITTRDLGYGTCVGDGPELCDILSSTE